MRPTRSDVALLIGLLIVAAEVGAIWTHPGSTQWDFHIYYHAARAHSAGANPYDPTVLQEFSGAPHTQGFIYPPPVLRAFQPITALDYATAARLWLVFKLLALFALASAWRRLFLPRIDRGLFVLVVVLGFSGAALWDLRSGNANLFEQLLLWSAFAAYLRRRYRLFTAGVVAAAAFKLLPAAFLLLLFAPRVPRRERWYAAAGAAALLGIVLVPAVAHPRELEWFLNAVRSNRPSGEVNPSILGLLDGMAGWVSGAPDVPHFWPVPVWAVLSAAIAWISRGTLRDAAGNPDGRVLIFTSVIVYALCVPRFMIYSGLLLIVPLLGFARVFMERWGDGAWGWFAIALVLCAPGLGRVPPMEIGSLLSASAPLALTLGMWVILRRFDLRALDISPAAGPLTPAPPRS